MILRENLARPIGSRRCIGRIRMLCQGGQHHTKASWAPLFQPLRHNTDASQKPQLARPAGLGPSDLAVHKRILRFVARVTTWLDRAKGVEGHVEGRVDAVGKGYIIVYPATWLPSCGSQSHLKSNGVRLSRVHQMLDRSSQLA